MKRFLWLILFALASTGCNGFRLGVTLQPLGAYVEILPPKQAVANVVVGATLPAATQEAKP